MAIVALHKMGEINKERRKFAEERPPQFDIKEFHDVVLSKGTVTMSILEEIIYRWVTQKIEHLDQRN